MAEENKDGTMRIPDPGRVEEPPAEEPEVTRRPGLREIFHHAFDKARQEQRTMNKSDKGRDRSRPLFLLAGAAIGVMLLFLVVFSSPNVTKKDGAVRPTTPDVGRRVTPGQPAGGQSGSLTPLLTAQTEQPASPGTQAVTPEDVNETARLTQSASVPSPPNSAPEGKEGQYALGRIDFSGSPQRQQKIENNEASAHSVLDDLKKPSLVFVRNTQSDVATSNSRIGSFPVEGSPATLVLPAGTRLVARLESVVTSAVKSPVVAAIEYNYVQDGEVVVPAGATAIGSLTQADRSGYVAIHFRSLELPNGTSRTIDGAAMSLSYGPLKGRVSGKRTGTNFLVRAFTGVGEAATYLVGSGGLSAPLSESAFLRDRMATNIGLAGDQELNSLGFNHNITVTVSANTRFYIVMEKGEEENPLKARPAAAARGADPPLASLDELRQLMQLRQELSEMYRRSSPAGSTPQ